MYPGAVVKQHVVKKLRCLWYHWSHRPPYREDVFSHVHLKTNLVLNWSLFWKVWTCNLQWTTVHIECILAGGLFNITLFNITVDMYVLWKEKHHHEGFYYFSMCGALYQCNEYMLMQIITVFIAVPKMYLWMTISWSPYKYNNYIYKLAYKLAYTSLVSLMIDMDDRHDGIELALCRNRIWHFRRDVYSSCSIVHTCGHFCRLSKIHLPSAWTSQAVTDQLHFRFIVS